MYKFYNANSLGKFTDDCVIRSISCATDVSWDHVYDYLSDLAQEYGTLLDNREFVLNYLDRTYQRLDDVYGTVGYVSGHFPNNILIISMSGHLVCSKYGTVYDTFDCRNRVVEYVWLVK